MSRHLDESGRKMRQFYRSLNEVFTGYETLEETDRGYAFTFPSKGGWSAKIERFRDAPSRKAREEVARQLIRDARDEDVEVRAHAVWAMVSLGGRGFKAALQQASQDADAEISNLALDGLRRLGEVE